MDTHDTQCVTMEDGWSWVPVGLVMGVQSEDGH